MKFIILFFIALTSTSIVGQDITGQWITYDDKTKEQKSVIEIYENQGVYSAKIIDVLIGNKNALCKNCTGSNKNKPFTGMIIIEALSKNNNEFSGGDILDPDSGEYYSCYLQLVDKDKLKVRGYLGISIFGRTQYWIRK